MKLKARKDYFRLLFPKDFIPEHINKKYSLMLNDTRDFITVPIDFLNETIQKVQVLGINDGAVEQAQHSMGMREGDIFAYPANNVPYRNSNSPIVLIDKTLNITFKHTLGFINYFLLLECFMYQYDRKTSYLDLIDELVIDILDDKGSIFFKLILEKPIIDGMDMLELDYTQPTAASDTFNVTLKYSNFRFEFVDRTKVYDN